LRQTPLLNGLAVSIGLFLRVLKTCLKAGVLDFPFEVLRAFLFSWLIVGIILLSIKNSATIGCEIRINYILKHVNDQHQAFIRQH